MNLEEENPIWNDITLSEDRKKFLSEERSDELFKQGDLDGAYREISVFIRHMPTNVAAYIRRACVNYESDNLDGVVEDFTDAINCGAVIFPSTSRFTDFVDPCYDQIHLLRALAYALAGKEYQILPDLVADYKTSLEKEYRDSLWGKSFFELTENEKAADRFITLISKATKGKRTPVQEALLSTLTRDHRTGALATKELIETDPTNPIVIWTLGLNQEGNEDQIKLGNKTITYPENEPEMSFVRGFKAMLSQDYEWGRKLILEAIGLNPDNYEYYEKLGVFLAWDRHYEEAIVYLTKAIELNPSAKDSFFNRGFAYQKTGELSRALEDFTEVIELESAPGYVSTKAAQNKIDALQSKPEPKKLNKPARRLNPSELQQLLFQAYDKFQAENWKGCIEDISLALEQDPENSDYYLLRGLSYKSMDMFDKFVDDVNKVIRLNDSAEIRDLLGSSYLDLGEYEQAIKYLNRCIELYPYYPHAYFARAKAKQEIGDYIGIIPDLEIFCQLGGSPDVTDLHEVRNFIEELKEEHGWEGSPQQFAFERGESGRALEEQTSKKAESEECRHDLRKQTVRKKSPRRLNSNELQQLLLQAYGKYQADDWEGCIKDMSLAIEQDPGNSVYYLLRGQSNYNLDLHNEALEDASNGIRLEPDNESLHFLRAGALTSLDKYDDALESLDRVISLVPEDQNTYFVRGQLFAGLGDRRSAISDYQMFIELTDLDPRVGEIQEAIGELSLKVSKDDQAISIAGNWTEPKKIELFNQHMKRAIDLHEQKKYEEALDALEIAHNLNPAHEVVFSMRMFIYDTLQDLEKGIANLAEQAQFYPDDSTVRMNLGVLKSKAGKNEEALADLVMASKLDPDNAKIRLTLGTLYLMSGHNHHATEHLSRCIELDPTIPDAHLYRASAKEKMDDFLGAIPDLENYIRLGGSPNADVQKLRAHIEEVKEEYGWEGSPEQLAQEREQLDRDREHLAGILEEHNAKKAKFEERKQQLQKEIEVHDQKLEKLTQESNQQIACLKKERDGLGFLAFGKKKDIEQKIAALQKSLEDARAVGESLQKKQHDLKM